MQAGRFTLRRPATAALIAVALVVAADQVSKWAVRAAGGSLPWHIAGGLRIVLEHNSGISFGRFSGGGALLLAAVIVVTVSVSFALLVSPRSFAFGLALILGGSLGNLVDRLRVGSVTDFVVVYWWPPFNFADAAIFLGTLVVIYHLVVMRRTPT
jgi:signal peptidase II